MLHFAPLAAAERRIGEDDVVAVLLLKVHHVLVERVCVWTMFGASIPCKIMFIMPMM